MSDTSIRHLQTLSLIPREPRRISSTEIRRQLAELGYGVTHRTVQRDLQRLSTVFPLVCDDRELPHGWSWKRDGAAIQLPHMDPATALTFCLVDEHLKEMLPRGVITRLAPHFDQAQAALEKSGSKLAHWRDRIRRLPRYQPLQPPEVAQDVVEVLYEGLLEGRCLEVAYQPRHGEERVYRVHPLGLAFRDAVAYLVSSLWDYEDVVPLALHRFKCANLLDEQARVPAGFSLDDWVQKGGFDYQPTAEPVELEARFAPEAGYHLQETPLATDQRLEYEPGNSGWLRVRAEVENTHQLRWWLLGFGDKVEVLRPSTLRREMASVAEGLSQLYG
ncbi:putative DNA-binding transcriptional regulator YafY [Alkalispirillum mobile]|uniref:Putative DNA-binding transcriptional regulator YafY n=1 Tax=Alkalispirillum mobile TaxID=85925 RepID=A0A498C5Z3_9GAMM|nr:WYL domain-containing protein [Alkalispirillum mobile]RLK50427.1 putative DNA-binding transcriptional regulator YafY [Alkalispirillum mobile]